LGDTRAAAYALLQLSQYHRHQQQWYQAQTFGQQALNLAQRLQGADIIALTAKHQGTILKHQGDLSGAIAAYELAFEALQSLRQDLIAITTDVQFSFRENVEPIYRELVSLLLQAHGSELDPLQAQAQLQQARDVMEALQIAELDNFFGDACLATQPIEVENLDDQAAIFYPIILPDRLEVIVSLPHQPLRRYATPLPQTELEAAFRNLYSALHPAYPRTMRLQQSQKVYNWLIGPIATDLEVAEIQTLVFVLDGNLRNLPMAILHDGNQYLIEKYALALSPGLRLFPQGQGQANPSILAAGLTEANQGFPPLPAVQQEMERIINLSSNRQSEILLNQAFTQAAFQDRLNQTAFPIVHLATHGQFSADPDSTFLLTWDDQINLQEFGQLFRAGPGGISRTIELLVLSACQTAAGDQRAALGLAGLALRSGARSTLASLWSVNDRSTAALMTAFYQNLNQNLNPGQGPTTKAEALRQAQLALLRTPEYNHPYFWSAFVLVGNWL
jgi:CHAT domain-containing protein